MSASIAELVELPLLRSNLDEQDIARGCELARQHACAAVIVRPCDLDQAARWAGNVCLAAHIDGTATTSVKAFAVRDALRRGAREIDTILNTGKLRSRQFQYLEMELTQLAEACHESAARLKVHLESEYLDHELKILACRIGRRAGIDCLATNDAADLPMLREYARERFQLKFTGEVAALDPLLALREAGCSRVQLADPWPLVAAWQERQAVAEQQRT
jgi:deoxyribose-phosphate aldolase